jgi:hypothetical protein
VPIVCLYGPNPHMMKITFAVAIAAAVLMPAPLLLGAIPAEAQNLKMAQGIDVQIGRDRDDRDRRRRNDSVSLSASAQAVSPSAHGKTAAW